MWKNWVTFTKRTEDPKLSWLELQLLKAGVPYRRNGYSFHAPILQVPRDYLDRANSILAPIDDLSDDDPRFSLDPWPGGTGSDPSDLGDSDGLDAHDGIENLRQRQKDWP